MIIGDTKRWRGVGRAPFAFGDFQFCNLAGLHSDLLRGFDPHIVLSPLVGDDFDVVEVAIILARFEYNGRYGAISTYVPNAAIICAEVAHAAPAIDFDLLVLPAGPITNA